jgi:hypothetical protein
MQFISFMITNTIDAERKDCMCTADISQIKKTNCTITACNLHRLENTLLFTINTNRYDVALAKT